MRHLIAMLLGSVLLTGAAAQAPSPEEPPVRLKKKKKDEPKKTEPGVQNPEVKPEPMPPKPKLDEDLDLDPRDRPTAPRAEAREESEVVKRLARNTRLAEEKLGKPELGEPTRRLQEEILKDLDELIRQQNSDQANQQPQSGQSAQDEPSMGKEDPSQRRQARQRERQNRRGGQQTASRSPREGQSQGQGKPENPKGGGDARAQGDPKEPDKKVDLWGHLPEKERALMNKEMEQKFMDKYDELTKQYYQTIAKKSLKKD